LQNVDKLNEVWEMNSENLNTYTQINGHQVLLGLNKKEKCTVCI